MAKEFKLEIESDGTITMDTGKIDDEIHAAADAFQKELIKLAGGDVSVTHKHGRTGHTHIHAHGHEHEHTHEHEGH